MKIEKYDPTIERTREHQAKLDAIEALEDSIELLKQGWCQNSLATDSQGETIHPYVPQARSFCSMGSLYRSSFDAGFLPIVKTIAASRIGDVCEERGFAGMASFNDHPETTKEDVIDVFIAARAILIDEVEKAVAA